MLGGDDAGVATAFAEEEKLRQVFQAQVRTPRVRNTIDMGDLRGPSTSAAAAEAVAEAGGEEAAAAATGTKRRRRREPSNAVERQTASSGAHAEQALDGLFEPIPLSDGGIDAGNIFGKGKPRGPSRGPCSVEGCAAQIKSRGVCSRHAGEIHAQTQAKRPRALPGLAAAAAQTEAMGLHTSDIPGVTVAAGNAAYHAGSGHGGAAAVAAAAVQAAAEAEATAAELMQHYAGPAAAVARGDVKEGHELLTALHDRLRADPTTRARYVEAGLAMLAELLSLAEGSIADDDTWAALKGLLHDGALLDVLGLGEARAAVERVLRERESRMERLRLAKMPNLAAASRIKNYELVHGVEWKADTEYMWFCCSDDPTTWGKGRRRLMAVILPKVAEMLQIEERAGADVAQTRCLLQRHCEDFARSLDEVQAHVLAAAVEAKAGVAINNFPPAMTPEGRHTHTLCRFCRLFDTTLGQIEAIGSDGTLHVVVRYLLYTMHPPTPPCALP